MSNRLREELQRYLVVSAYLYVCLGALLLFEDALLQGTGVPTLSAGIALGKALVLGKFVLIGEAVHLGERGVGRSVLARIAWRTVLFAALLVVLTIIEEILVGKAHGRPMSQTLAEFGGHALDKTLAECLLMLLILLPLVTVIEVNRALGPGKLRDLLLGTAPRL